MTEVFPTKATRWMGCVIAACMVLGLDCSARAGEMKVTPVCNETVLENFEPSGRGGLFAAWIQGDKLIIELLVAFKWLDGSPDEVPGFKAGEYRWVDDDEASKKLKKTFQKQFADRVAEAWSAKYSIEAHDGSRRLEVQVQVTPSKPEQAHWLVEVSRYPMEGSDRPASVCLPGSFHLSSSCAFHGESQPWGTVRLATSHLRRENVRKLEMPPYDVFFDPGKSDIPALESPGWLAGLPEWRIQLTGFASEVEASEARPRDCERHATTLAKARVESVRTAIISLMCPAEQEVEARRECEEEIDGRLSKRVQGSYGDSPYPERNFVRVELLRAPTIDTITHEAGHMLGLGDEASDEFGEVGDPLNNAAYAALVYWYTGHLVVRADDEGIMSRGDVVRPWHYAPFLEAVEKLTCSSKWKIVDSSANVRKSNELLPGPAPSWTRKRPERPEKKDPPCTVTGPTSCWTD